MPSVIVTGDFVPTGGMDRANLALAEYLAEGDEVHLVGHRVATELLTQTNVRHHRVPKPMNSYVLAAPFLDQCGRMWASRVSSHGGRIFVNGGSCCWGDVNWVHYVHAAYRPRVYGPALRKLKSWCSHKLFLSYERTALARARLCIANSESTRRNLIQHYGISPARIRTVYYGTDPSRFRPATTEERSAARISLGWPQARPVLVFVGALGDHRKGFDVLFTAWQALCAREHWDAHLAVVGTGSELPAWQARAHEEGVSKSVQFLGFRKDVPKILRAAEGLVSPTRYEPYGLNVHEALCCGLPALVTRTAGVAERYSREMNELLLADPPCAQDLMEHLLRWRLGLQRYCRAAEELGARLRQRTWSDMARNIVQVCGPPSTLLAPDRSCA